MVSQVNTNSDQDLLIQIGNSAPYKGRSITLPNTGVNGIVRIRQVDDSKPEPTELKIYGFDVKNISFSSSMTKPLITYLHLYNTNSTLTDASVKLLTKLTDLSLYNTSSTLTDASVKLLTKLTDLSLYNTSSTLTDASVKLLTKLTYLTPRQHEFDAYRRVS